MSRHDMFVELASDQVSQVQDLIDQGRYEEVHSWLQPLFLEVLRKDFAEFSDDDLTSHYYDQLGVELP